MCYQNAQRRVTSDFRQVVKSFGGCGVAPWCSVNLNAEGQRPSICQRKLIKHDDDDVDEDPSRGVCAFVWRSELELLFWGERRYNDLEHEKAWDSYRQW